jgi:hypothetical protein
VQPPEAKVLDLKEIFDFVGLILKTSPALAPYQGSESGPHGVGGTIQLSNKAWSLGAKVRIHLIIDLNSPGGIRTCDQSVNSRPLYH